MRNLSQISVKFLVPGLFLLLLGIGNIAVGHFKGAEYEQVLAELSEAHTTPTLVNASPLRRIEFARQSANRLSQRQNKARARQHFYQLVTFGGKAFVLLSSVLLVTGLCLRLVKPAPKRPLTAGT